MCVCVCALLNLYVSECGRTQYCMYISYIIMHTQGRLFSYVDTHRHRLGANYHQIPVNCPYATRPRNYQRDGPMTTDDNQGTYIHNILVCAYVCVRTYMCAYVHA